MDHMDDFDDDIGSETDDPGCDYLSPLRGCRKRIEDDESEFPDGAYAEISQLLQAVPTVGEFSFGGRATTLPAMPGLHLDSAGDVPLPLTAKSAEIVIAQCQVSPYGTAHDTIVDEQVRKSWQTEMNRVTFKNPQWEVGMAQLGKVITHRLGYDGVTLELHPYKLLVYGPGGHFVKHQDTEKKDGMIATLVVQPPSLHEGGDLVVFSKNYKHRHDFGKTEGTAAFETHYAVHFADAEHELEPVKSGFRLALVYSVCLPADKRSCEIPHLNGDVERLSELMREIEEWMTLFLNHEYTNRSMTDLGSAALKGRDRARVSALMVANSLLPPENQFRFYLAQMNYVKEVYNEEVRSEDQFVSAWFSVDGGALHHSGRCDGAVTYSNVLNPDEEGYYELWGERGRTSCDGYLGNETAAADKRYCRYALVAWPAAKDCEFSFKFIGERAAILAWQARRAVVKVNNSELETFLTTIAGAKTLKWQKRKMPTFSTGFFRCLSDILVESGSVSSALVFIKQLLPRARARRDRIETVVRLTKGFGVSLVTEEVVDSLSRQGLLEAVCLELGRDIAPFDRSIIDRMKSLGKRKRSEDSEQ